MIRKIAQERRELFERKLPFKDLIMGLTSSTCEKGLQVPVDEEKDEEKECQKQVIRETQYKCRQGHYHPSQNDAQNCNENEISQTTTENKSTVEKK